MHESFKLDNVNRNVIKSKSIAFIMEYPGRDISNLLLTEMFRVTVITVIYSMYANDFSPLNCHKGQNLQSCTCKVAFFP